MSPICCPTTIDVVDPNRLVSPSDLVGVTEIAGRLDSRPSVIQNWRARGIGFPEPLIELAMGALWDWADVVSWAKATGRMDADGNPTKPPRSRRTE